MVNNIVVFERETFEVIIPEMAVERAVLLKLKDYFDERSVSLVKVKTLDGLSVLIISEMMNCQAHAPLQTLLLPMRIALLATDATNIYSCPHVWSLDPKHQTGDLFLVTDHANISASSPGIGPNI